MGRGTSQSVENGAFNWSASDPVIKGASRAGIEVLPFLYGRSPLGPSPAVDNTGTDERDTGNPACQERTSSGPAGPISSPRRCSVTGPRARSGRKTRGAVTAGLGLGESGTRRTSSTSWRKPNPAEYGKLVKLSTGRSRGLDPGAKSSWAGCSPGPRGRGSKSKPKGLLRQRLPGRGVQAHPGHQVEVQRLRAASLHREISLSRRRLEEFRDALADHDAGKGLWITELGWSSAGPKAGDAQTSSRRA